MPGDIEAGAGRHLGQPAGSDHAPATPVKPSRMNVQAIKQRFGTSAARRCWTRAIEVAAQVAPTDLTVLITGGERFGQRGDAPDRAPAQRPQAQALHRGELRAIPEGTIDKRALRP